MSSKSLVEALEEAFLDAREMDAPLNERLDAVAAAVRALSPAFAETVDALINRLQMAAAGASAPAIGEAMPPFVLPDVTRQLVSLPALLAKGPTAVAFHRGHWCPYCRLNAAALSQVQGEIKDAGGQIVVITPDRQKFASMLKSESGGPFPVLTDIDNGYALSLNLAIWCGEAMSAMIAKAGWDIPTYQGNATWMLPIPATFVIGTDGIITARYIDPDYRKRMAVEDLIEAFKHTR